MDTCVTADLNQQLSSSSMLTESIFIPSNCTARGLCQNTCGHEPIVNQFNIKNNAKLIIQNAQTHKVGEQYKHS